MEWACQTLLWPLALIDLDEGVHEIQRLQITTPQVIPHGVRWEGLLRVLSWVSFDLPEHLKTTLSALLVAAGEGTLSYKQYPLSDGTFGMVSLIRKLNYLHQEDPMMREDCWFTTYWRNSCVVFHYVPSSSYWTWCFRN